MERFEDVVAPQKQIEETPPLKKWRLKFQDGSLGTFDFTEFFINESKKYYNFDYEYDSDCSQPPTLKCVFNDAAAKEEIIDVLMEFILGDNPKVVLDKLQKEGNSTGVCGKVFKNGEPTYSCRTCGMDPTCVLCVNCFKQSQHRFHKYKMSTSGGGGCCDCGDEEAWKNDHYCEVHLRAKENPVKSNIITDAVEERCEIAFTAILSFCVVYLEVETNASLEGLDGDEQRFCTVLYNDESHTFDQVIQTLVKNARCKQRDASEMTSSIDREGRAVVKFGTFEECHSLKESIEKQPVTVSVGLQSSNRVHQSLKVSVLHINAVSCQQFAIQLLSWFQDFLIKHITFRKIFAKIVLDKKSRFSIRHLLEIDVKLWKTARTCWHRLLISGMLMEYDNKLALAQEFSRHYATVIQDFIRDDHDHSFSIVSLSVQLFTVPSIAHNLIANEGIFYKLLHTFYHESIEPYISNKTLRFAKHTSNMNYFKRASHILYDLRYILSFKPDEWTDALREGFLEGCKMLLKVLNVMQGMESVTRQTGQHMDYEPEWESAFNLHIKLACTISLVLEWSATDKQVLQKLYVLVMRYLTCCNQFIVNAVKKVEKSYAGHVANCLIYDVLSKPISIHLPLSRLFAGVFLSLGNYGLTFDNISTLAKRTPEEIIEPILCTQVMIAQVHSGLWRRNGYSLLHQLFFYRNVRCRAEMIDRDIVGMQIGAALIESNQYLIILLNKFNLLDWAQDDYDELLNSSAPDDDFIKLLGMIDEFLEFLIVIIGERWMPGLSDLTEEDRLKKEIIQLLCIKPYSHSELNRALPDSNNEAVLEDVIESVAIFKKPQVADAKGVYELKEELYDSYNMYFYHYTKEEKSKSEETQRLRRKMKGELECCPPPNLPKLTDSFVSIANLLQCDVMMKLISTILKRALDLKRKSFQESHLQKILHLIGYGLQEESSGHYPFLSFCERSKEHQILQNLEDLSRSSRVESHRDFIIWTIKKFKEVQSQTTSEPYDENLVEMENEDGEAPLTAAEKEKKEKDERKRRAEKRRQLIMEQIEKQQREFMQSNKIMYNKPGEEEEAGDDLIMECDVEGAVAYKSTSCLGYDRRIQITEDESFNCMLCSEECVLSKDGPTLVYPSYIQKSKVLSSDFPENNYAIYISSCGHVMHADCWKEYFNNEECKEHRRLHRPRPAQKNDFQCPYCRCLSNAVLPLTAPLTKYATPNVLSAGDENLFPIDQWLELMKSFSDNLTKLRSDMHTVRWHKEFPRLKDILNHAQAVAGNDSFTKIANVSKNIHLSDNWIQYTQNFIKSIHTTFQLDSAKSLEWLWRSCTYTIQSIEVFLRATNKPFSTDLSIRHTSCLSGLIRGSLLYGLNLSSNDIESLVVLVTEHLDTLFKYNKKSVLEWDCFSMMSMTIFMIPNLLLTAETDKNIITNGSIMDFYVLQTFFLANMLKAILQFDAANIYSTMDVDDDYEDLSLLYDSYDEVKNLSSKIKENIIMFYRKYNMPARVKSYKDSLKQQTDEIGGLVDGDGVKIMEEMDQQQLPQAIIECNDKVISALFDHIKNEMKEFLRCCCLFFHFVTDVDFPESFLSYEADSFENMCEYLGLSKNLGQYFDSENTYKTILEIFASHPDIINYNLETKKKCNGDDFIVIPCTKSIPKLYELPLDYSDLINCVSEITCPNNEKEEMRYPTLCLRCGVILCGQSYCCQPDLNSRPVGACTYHSSVCGADIGLFLRIRECELVYLGDSKGCYFQAPYLDDYGETDPHLKRGNPLHLSKERYNKLHLLWLGHGLHEEIARLNDNNSVPATQWHHM